MLVLNLLINTDYLKLITNLNGIINWNTIASLSSAISAVLMLIVTIRVFRWDSKRDLMDYVPQIFLRSEKKINLHPVVSKSSFLDFITKNLYQITLVNIGDKKIVNLEIFSEVMEDETYLMLLKKVRESGKEYIHFYESGYSYQGVLGGNYKSYDKKDLLDGNESTSIDMPGALQLALLGYNLMISQEKAENVSDITLNFRLSIKYRHAFANEKVEKTNILQVKFSYFDSNTTVQWESLLFDKE